MGGNRPRLVSCPSWLATMCEPTIWLTGLFCFYLLQFICSCENLYKNKVWGQTMEACSAPPCRGFYFTHYQMFPSVARSPFILLWIIPQIILLGKGRDTCAWLLSSKETETDRKSWGGATPWPPGLPTDMWTKTLRKSACMSITSFYSHGRFWSSCVLEESSWVGGGVVWPRSPGGQAFHQLLTQSCEPPNSGRSVPICKCAVLVGFFSGFLELRIPLLWSGLSDK